MRVVAVADLLDKRRGVRAATGTPRAGLRSGGGDRRRVDLQDLLGGPFERGAKWTAGTADPERGDLLQVEESLGLRRGDHPPVQFPRGAGEPARIGRAVRVQ